MTPSQLPRTLQHVALAERFPSVCICSTLVVNKTGAHTGTSVYLLSFAFSRFHLFE